VYETENKADLTCI